MGESGPHYHHHRRASVKARPVTAAVVERRVDDAAERRRRSGRLHQRVGATVTGLSTYWTVYYFRVRAVNEAGTSDWSPMSKIEL